MTGTQYSNVPQSSAGDSVRSDRTYPANPDRRESRRGSVQEANDRRRREELEAEEGLQLNLEAARARKRNKARDDHRARATLRGGDRDRSTGFGSSLVSTNRHDIGPPANSFRDYGSMNPGQEIEEQRSAMESLMREELEPMLRASGPFIDPRDSIRHRGAQVLARERFIQSVMNRVPSNTRSSSIQQPASSYPEQRRLPAPQFCDLGDDTAYEGPVSERSYVPERRETYDQPRQSSYYHGPEPRRRSTRDDSRRGDGFADYDRYRGNGL